MILARIDRWSGPAFMFGGGALLVGLVSLAFEAVTDWFVVAGGSLFMSGLGAIIAGLLGLYSRLADRNRLPRFARVGAGIVAGLVGLALLALLGIGALVLLAELGLNVPEAPPFGVVTAPLFGGVVLGHVVIGLVAWRADAPFRTVGELLIALAGLWIIAFVVGLRTPDLDRWDLLAFGIPAVGTIVVGHLLREHPDGDE